MIHLLEIAICTLPFYAFFHYILKSKSSYTFNRIFLLSAMVLSFIIPIISIPVFPVHVLQDVTNQNLSPIISENHVTATVQNATINWLQILTIIYLTGLVIHLLIMVKNIHSVTRMIRNGTREKYPDHYRVITNSSVPISSFFQYLFISNTQQDRISPFEIEHELVHIRQKHSMDLLFMELMRAVLWFNPILPLYRRRLVEVHEFIADHQTSLRQNKKDYLAYLSRQAMESAAPELIHNFYSLFEKRMHMLHHPSKPKSWNYFLILPLLLFLMSSFSFSSYIVVNPMENPGMTSDTIPPQSIQILDTVVVYDPERYEETVTVTTKELIRMDQSDTVFVYDPLSQKETVEIRETYIDSSIEIKDPANDEFKFTSDKLNISKDTILDKNGDIIIRTLIYQ